MNRLISSCLAIIIAIYPVIFPLAVRAEDTIIVEPTPEPSDAPTDTSPTPEPSDAPTGASPTPEPTPEITPEPSDVPNSTSPSDAPTGASPVASDAATVAAAENAVSTPSAETIIDTDNQTTSTTQDQAETTTGENTSVSQENASMVTGDALAIVDQTNVANVIALNSPFTVATFTITPTQLTNLDLNRVWQELQTVRASADSAALTTFLLLHNYISLQNYVMVAAQTGDNRIMAVDTSLLQTGDAIAAANVVNLANTTLINTSLLIGIINIIPESTADLILPQPIAFFTPPSTASAVPASLSLANTATASGTVNLTAVSGNNAQTATQSAMETGDSITLANQLTLMNLSLFNTSFMSLFINNAGNWHGSLIDSYLTNYLPHPGTYSYFFGSQPAVSACTVSGCIPAVVDEENQATVINQVSVTASTGNNQVASTGNSTVITGQATAIANILNLFNLNLINSTFFIGIANILGSWFGNIIYAYPDIGVRFTNTPAGANPGDTITYTLTVGNYGYEAAPVIVSLDLPNDTTYLQDSSGVSPQITGSHLTWELGSFSPQQETSFSTTIKVNESFHFTGQAIVPHRPLIPQAYAADTPHRDITLTASIFASGPELGRASKTGHATTHIYQPTDPNTSPDDRQTNLKLSVSHNVNNYLYLGDTATFEVVIENTSDVSAENTVFSQQIFDAANQLVAVIDISLGDINPAKKGTLRFGVTFNDDGVTFPGTYTTTAIATANSPNGKEISSNESGTTIVIKGHSTGAFLTIPQAHAQGFTPGQILGTQASLPQTDIFAYFLLTLLSLLWYVTKHFQKQSPPRQIIPILLNLLAYLFVTSIFAYSVYVVGTHYGFIQPIAQLTTLQQQLLTSLN